MLSTGGLVSQAEGAITPEMAVAAKVAILDELGGLPIEELSQTELDLRAEDIRNSIFAPYLQKQQDQMERQKDRHQKETLRRQEASEAHSRRAQRKAALIELGVARALRLSRASDITGRALVLLEWQVRARLETLLVGDEMEPHVEETIEASIMPPIIEWAARTEEIQRVKKARMVDQCLALALPVAEATLPWVKDSIVKMVCEKFGLHPAYTPPPDDAGTSSENVKPAETSPPHAAHRQGSSPPSVTTSPQDSTGEGDPISQIRNRGRG